MICKFLAMPNYPIFMFLVSRNGDQDEDKVKRLKWKSY